MEITEKIAKIKGVTEVKIEQDMGHYILVSVIFEKGATIRMSEFADIDPNAVISTFTDGRMLMSIVVNK